MTYSLAHYLAPARYEGFDIMDRLVGSCQQTVTPRFPNFTFRKADIYNRFYDPGGTVEAADFTFPYGDGEFDFVFLTSVFTHMGAREVRRYLGEIRRVLRPGGRCLCTFFLLNEESGQLIREGRSTLDMTHPLGEGFTAFPRSPEEAVGFEEPRVLGWVAEHGLTPADTYHGRWCGRPRFVAYQDFLVLFG
jgi:SAM-dependent methyltransferase